MSLLKADNNVIISPQGYKPPEPPEVKYPFYDDTTPEIPENYVKSVIFSEEDGDDSKTYNETVTNYDGTETKQSITVPNAVSGPQGEKGDTGATPDLSMSATVDDTTGTPSVTVTKSGTTAAPSFALSFTGLKGAKGDTGEAGPQGETGPQGPAGSAVSKSGLVTNISVTNENGIYSVKETKYNADGETTSETEAGAIEVPEIDTSNILAEVTDSIIENTASGYDYHTIKETEYNGTQNNVGSFYVARDQITGVALNGSELEVTKVNQSGEISSQQIELPTSQGEKGDTGATPDLSMSATVDDTTGTPSVTVTKSGTTAAPSFALAFTGLKGAKGDTGETGATGASPTVVSTGSTESGASAGTITGTDGTQITVYNGAQGAKGDTGETGPQGPAGSDATLTFSIVESPHFTQVGGFTLGNITTSAFVGVTLTLSNGTNTYQVGGYLIERPDFFSRNCVFLEAIPGIIVQFIGGGTAYINAKLLVPSNIDISDYSMSGTYTVNETLGN